MLNESAFLVTNASGRPINLLNDNNNNNQEQFTAPSPPLSEISDGGQQTTSTSLKRKYHCTEPGCTKSFTTSGHLARHNRIHTGEKNFPCLFPGCQSRFSRQDNMMQHYRTHMSPKSRRTQKRVISEDLHPRPKLHAHQRIRSDPYRVERPLTIDQHLNNYRESLLSNSSFSSIKHNMPIPLGSVATSYMQQKQQQQQQTWEIEQEQQQEEEEELEQSPTVLLPPPPPPTDIMFYQHRPLTFSNQIDKSLLPFTLLHPTCVPTISHHVDLNQVYQQESNNITPSLSSSSTSSNSTTTDNPTSSAKAGLLQLANIVSTFG